MHTTPEMNAQIVDILRTSSEPHSLYAAARIEELEGIVDRLPETADGVRVVPIRSTTVFRILTGGDIQASNGWRGECPQFRCADEGEPTYGDLIQAVDLCYSTRAAAEAAKKQP